MDKKIELVNASIVDMDSMSLKGAANWAAGLRVVQRLADLRAALEAEQTEGGES